MLSSFPTVRGVRWLRALLWFLLSVLGLGLAQAEPKSPPGPLPALASGVPCGLLGDCARFDALGVHVGSTIGLAQRPSKSLALVGRTRVSVSMLDALEVSVSLGAQHGSTQGESASWVSVQPLSFGVRLRLWPWFDRAGPDLALSITQTVPSRWLGSGEARPETAVNLAGSKLWRWLELDGSVGVLWRDGVTKPLGLRLSASSLVRLYQTPDPTLPRDSYRFGVQASALFPIDTTTLPSSLTALAVFEAATDRGLRFHLGIGAQAEGLHVGGIALAQLSYSWGLRYRNRDGRAGIGGMPDWYLDYFMVDPILEADGCLYTDPSSIGRIKIICVGTPDPIDAGTIVHNDGRRFPVGLHVWIDKTDGTLMTEDRQILARPDEKTAKLAIVVQQLVEVVRRREQKTGKPCFLRGGILHAVSDASLASMVAHDEHGGGAALLGYELARMIFCDAEPLAGGVPSPLSLLGKGLRGSRSLAGDQVRDVIEHDRPAAAPTASSAPTKPSPGTAATKAEAASEAASLLTDPNRKHIFKGEVRPKQADSVGWHLESSGDKDKGTYVIGGTRSPSDAHGVYEGNVMIEGVRKKARSTFFPKDWTEKQVESAIEEAYKSRKPDREPGIYTGQTSSGVEVEMQLTNKGQIHTAYPLYKGPKYKGPAR